MDMGITIFTEDELDNMDLGYNPLSHGLMPGCNIKTSCYGLFLVALQKSKAKASLAIVQEALNKLDSIQNCTLFNALSLHYPPENVTTRGIIKVAKSIIILADLTHGQTAEQVPADTVDTIVNSMVSILGLRPGVIMIRNEDECEAERG